MHKTQGHFRRGLKVKGSNEIEQPYWMIAINWTRRFQPKTKKWQIKAKSTWHHFGVKFIGSNPQRKKSLKRRAHDLKNQDASQGPREGPTQGFNFASIESKLVATNLDHGPLSKVSLSIWKTGNLAKAYYFQKNITQPSWIQFPIFRVNNEVEDNVGQNFNYPQFPRTQFPRR